MRRKVGLSYTRDRREIFDRNFLAYSAASIDILNPLIKPYRMISDRQAVFTASTKAVITVIIQHQYLVLTTHHHHHHHPGRSAPLTPPHHSFHTSKHPPPSPVALSHHPIHSYPKHPIRLRRIDLHHPLRKPIAIALLCRRHARLELRIGLAHAGGDAVRAEHARGEEVAFVAGDGGWVEGCEVDCGDVGDVPGVGVRFGFGLEGGKVGGRL